jgi:hypothetical protein
MTIDTPIISSATKSKVAETTVIAERIGRTRVFLGYLKECANSLNDLEGRNTCLSILAAGYQDCDTVERNTTGFAGVNKNEFSRAGITARNRRR